MSENEERLYAKRLISQFQEENERLREENEDHKKQGLELVAEVASLRARLAECELERKVKKQPPDVTAGEFNRGGGSNSC